MGVVTRRTTTDADLDGRYDSAATERRWALDAADVVSLVAGLIVGVIGLLALVELGFSDFPSEATTEVAGMGMTQLWAIASIVLGLLLVAGCGSVGRSTMTFAGAITLVAGIVIIAAGEDLDATMLAESSYGWLLAIIGAVVLVAAIAIPTVAHRHDRVVEQY
jgi:hypothetical protein